MNSYKISNIPGGARVILIPNESRKLACISVLIRCGSRNEPKQYHGISHFLEHMLFKGTTQYPETSSIPKELDRIGGSYNATTSKNITNYFICDVVPEKVDTAVDILSSLVLEPLLKEEHMENEKMVVIEELNQSLDDHMDIAGDIAIEEIFKGTSLEHSTIGTTDKIINLTHEDMVGYYISHYRLDNIVVAISGKFNPEIEQYVMQKFSLERTRPIYSTTGGTITKPLKKCMNHKYKLSVEEQLTDEDFYYYPKYSGKIEEVQLNCGGTLKLCSNKTLKQCVLYIAFPAHGIFSEQQFFSTMNELILGGNMSSRLFKELREDNGLVYSFDVNSLMFVEAGFFYVACSGDLPKFEKIFEVVLKNLVRMKQEVVLEEEYEFNLEHITGKITGISDDLMKTANFYGTQLLFDKPILTFEKLLKRKYNSRYITRERMLAVMADILDFSNVAIAVVGNIERDSIIRYVNDSIDSSIHE